MSSPSLVIRLIDAADNLVDGRPGSAAFRRRAVSTAYYAVFHALAKLCTRTFLPKVSSDAAAYERVYRSLEHGPMKNAFGQSPLKDHPTLRRLGNIIVRLQDARIRADYLPPDRAMFPQDEVRDLLAQARELVGELDQLDAVDRLTLASCLMFRAGRPAQR